MADRDSMFDKIRALLRKAESTEFPEEAAAFYQKAQELMLKYVIEEEELWASEPDKREHPTTIVIEIPKSKTGAQSRRIILNACAKANSCIMWYRGNVCSIAGYQSDLLFVEMLFASINIQMSMALAFGLAKAQSDPRSFRASFLVGYSDMIWDRLLGKQEEVKQASQSTELVLVSRQQLVERYVEDLVGPLRSRSARVSIGSSEGYASGIEAGSKADLSVGAGRITQRERKGLESGS